MKIGIISDTHDHRDNVTRAISVFKENNVKYVFHAGDFVSPFTARAFRGLNGIKLIAVFGNCDGEKIHLKEAVEEIGGKIYDNAFNEKVEQRQIYMVHRPDGVNEVAESGRYDLVIYGHTHKQDIRYVNKTLIVNPGEATDWLTGKGSVVIVELDDLSYEEILLK